VEISRSRRYRLKGDPKLSPRRRRLKITREQRWRVENAVDDEPSLGSLDGRMNQLGWGVPDRDVLLPNTNLEHDEAELEDGAH
jgi:hypothetical protein